MQMNISCPHEIYKKGSMGSKTMYLNLRDFLLQFVAPEI